MCKRVIIFVVLSALFFGVFVNLGNIIVQNESPIPSDIALILMGSKADRALFARDFYKQNYCKKLLFVATKEVEFSKFRHEGINIMADTQVLRSVLIQGGVPDSNIVILSGPCSNTADEAAYLADFCKTHPEVNSVSIITSSYHSSRASKIFHKVFDANNLDVQLYIPFNKYTDYSPGNWYKSKAGIVKTGNEVMKYLYYFLWQRWTL